MVPKSPKISVVIPVKNMAGKIEQCLKAVFAQSLPPYEVVVVDGRSTDGTAERAQNFPVKIFYQDYGAAGAAQSERIVDRKCATLLQELAGPGVANVDVARV